MKQVFIFFFALATFLVRGITPVKAQERPRPDTILVVNLQEQKVRAERLWANDTVRYRYNQTKYYVTTVLPYVQRATVLFKEINSKLSTPGLSNKVRKQYVASYEDQVRREFEDKVKVLNSTQGTLLIKLIARQTELNVYNIISDTKGSIPAIKYQAWARLQGFNLNKKYNPTDEPMLEHIMEGLGYPLPSGYGIAEDISAAN